MLLKGKTFKHSFNEKKGEKKKKFHNIGIRKKKKEAIRIIGKKYTERTKNETKTIRPFRKISLLQYICIKLINTKKK